MDKREAACVAAIAGAGFAVRLAFGMHLPLEADEATTGLTSHLILTGHLAVMESNAQYQGALESYVMAPFIAVIGSNLAAIRIAMSFVGMLYVLAMYGLGRALFPRSRMGLLLAACAAVFPLFELTWNMHARSGYAEMIVFEVVCLTLAARLGWGEASPVPRWAVLGLIAGIAAWSYSLVLVPLSVIAVALLVRAPQMGWGRFLPRALAALAGGAVGFLPWLAYNLTHGLPSLRAIPNYHTGLASSVTGLTGKELPIFFGAWGSCDDHTVIPAFAWLIIAVIVGAVVAQRRAQLTRLLRLRLASLEPVEMVLAVAPAALLAVLVGRFNGIPCEPRYLLPFAVPAALGAAMALRVRFPLRTAVLLLAGVYAVIATVTAAGRTTDSLAGVPTGGLVPSNPSPAVRLMHEHNVTAVFGYYWLIRPVQYLDEGRIPVEVYGGWDKSFPDARRAAEAAPHPSWLFASGDTNAQRLAEMMRGRGITADVVNGSGYVLYANLSQPIRPSDLGLT